MIKKIGKIFIKKPIVSYDLNLNSFDCEVNIGVQKIKKHNLFKLLLCGFFVGFINGFWGGGGGMICVPVLTYILKIPEKIAHATTILIILPLTISSLIVYLIKTNIDFKITTFVGIGFVLGGVIGAMLLKSINNVILRIVFNIIIIAGGIRLLF